MDSIELFKYPQIKLGGTVYTKDEIKRALNHCVAEYAFFMNSTPNNLQSKILQLEFRPHSAPPPEQVIQRFYIDPRTTENDEDPLSESVFGSLRKEENGDWFLSFRGTMRAYEWLKNSKFLLNNCLWDERSKVHAGFLEMYKQMRMDILRASKKIEQEGGQLWITGHSLGGAIAQLASIDLVDLNPKVIVFGSPMVGNHLFTSLLEDTELLRVQNHGDLIVQLPVAIESLKGDNVYKHAGKVLQLESMGDKPMVDVLKENVFAHLPSSYRKGIDELQGVV